MTIQDLGALGELIASIGVVVSLIYLSLQTRANTKAIKSQTRSSLTDQILSVQIAAFQSISFQEAFLKTKADIDLVELEKEILQREALLFFKHMENAQYQYDSGLYDKSEYEAQKAIWVRRFQNHAYWRDAWVFFKDVLSPRLVEEIDPILQKIDSEGGT
jgi:hypothetical protein